MELRQKTIRGVKWTVTSTVCNLLTQVILLAVLARYLKFSEFGLMATVNMIIGFSQTFMDMGISNAIIHHQKISHTQLSTLYWLNILAGVVVFIVVCALAPFISLFYGEKALTPLIVYISSIFLIIPFGQQFQILMQKELKFSAISKIEIITKSIGSIITILFAVMGFGVYALVYGTIITTFLSTLLFVYVGLKEHKPSLVFHYKELKGFLHFGIFQMLEKTINYFNLQFDTILIGKLLGMDALGIYSIPKEIVLKPMFFINPIVTRVTFPVMAKIQEQKDFLKDTYLKTINYLSSVNFPIYIALAIFAAPIIRVIFSNKWGAAVPILQVLSLWAMARSVGNPFSSLALAKGRADLGFYWNAILFLFFPLSIYWGSHWGVIGVCWALVVLQSILVFPHWYFLIRKLCEASFEEYFKQMLIPLSLAAFTGIVCFAATRWIGNYIIRLSVGISMGSCLYFILCRRYNPGFIEILKEFFYGKTDNTSLLRDVSQSDRKLGV